MKNNSLEKKTTAMGIAMKSTNTANIALQRFEKQLSIVNNIYLTKKQQEYEAKLYYNNGRTPFFMLESLCKPYRKEFNIIIFNEQLTYYKKIEDALGGIDYYDVLGKQAKDEIVKKYFKNQQTLAEKKLRALLLTGGKFNGFIELTNRINELKTVNWLDFEQDKKLIVKFIKNDFAKIKKDLKSGKLNFNTVENMHKVRRKLRWVSIFGQSLDGLIQLKKSKTEKEKFFKYKSVAVINSPFNKFPENKNLNSFIYFDEDNFFALSWIIAELGEMKDAGLTIIATNEARNKQLTGEEQALIFHLLKRSKNLVEMFLKDFEETFIF